MDWRAHQPHDLGGCLASLVTVLDGSCASCRRGPRLDLAPHAHARTGAGIHRSEGARRRVGQALGGRHLGRGRITLVLHRLYVRCAGLGRAGGLRVVCGMFFSGLAYCQESGRGSFKGPFGAGWAGRAGAVVDRGPGGVSEVGGRGLAAVRGPGRGAGLHGRAGAGAGRGAGVGARGRRAGTHYRWARAGRWTRGLGMLSAGLQALVGMGRRARQQVVHVGLRAVGALRAGLGSRLAHPLVWASGLSDHVPTSREHPTTPVLVPVLPLH